MPPPLDPVKRAAIEDAIRSGGMSRNQIAREHEVAQGTVSRIARALEAAGEPPAFDRAAVEAATQARAKDNAQRRADLEAEFLAVAAEQLAQRDRPCVWGNFGGKENTYAEQELERPTFGMVSTLVSTAARAAKAAADLAAGGDNPAEQGRAGVRTLVDELRAKRDERQAG